MRRMICIASGFLVTLMTTFTVQADDHMQVPAYGGVEVFGCDFAEGKDMDDLLDVSKKWDTWASKNNSQPYSGYLLQPYYYDDLDDEIYWVGFSPSLAAQGIVQAEWLAKGGELQQEFDSVIPCKSHGQLAWVRVVDEVESPSSQGIVDFAGCAMLPGGSQEKLAAADAKMNAFNAKIGNPARIYRWYPIQGASADAPEFYQAQWYDSLEAKGTAADLFVTNGGIQMQGALYGELLQCSSGPSFLYSYVGGTE